MRKFTFILSLLLLLSLSACGESDVEPNNKDNNGGNVTNDGAEDDIENDADGNASENTGEDIEEKMSIGDSVNFDGLKITLNNAYTSSGSDFEKPSNDHYVVLDLTIENTTDKSANISTLMQMALQDEEGYTHDITIFTGTQGSLDGEIGAGRSNRGEIAFDVNDSAVYEFIFDHPFTTGQAIWEIEIE